jgi:ADP-ribose pyrophosphatase YjhB (NUDIX family)
MAWFGVAVVVIDVDKILLTRREDFAVWCLPGGAVEDGESLAQAGVREVREETGIAVELTRLVGVYSRPRWWGGGMHSTVFAARPIGGALVADPHETTGAGYFALAALPAPLFWVHVQPIRDAVAGVGGVARTQHAAWPFGQEHLTRQELYALRDRSGLPRDEFYRRYLGPAPENAEALDVGGD